MLLFVQKIGETIVVNDEITLTLIRARDDDICMGIESSKSVSIDRIEIQEKVKTSNASRKLTDYVQEILKDHGIAKLYSIDEILFQRLLQGSPDAQFEIGRIFYQANELKLAQAIFELSLAQGIRASKYYLERIHQKHQKKYFNFMGENTQGY